MNFSQLISHPLLEEAGQSQAGRLPIALNPKNIRIDDRDMGDLLHFIYRFSRQVTYFNQEMQGTNWLPFFQKSLPFLIADIQQIDINNFEKQLNDFSNLIDNQPEKENLKSLFDYVSGELIQPLNHWQQIFDENQFTFSNTINNLISGNLQAPIQQYVSLYNGANKWYGLGQISFYELQQNDVWGLDFSDLFALDESFLSIPGGYGPRVIAIKNTVLEIAFQLLEVMSALSQNAIPFLKEVLVPTDEVYQKNHAPHLGLLFTFLELFKKFQGNLNQLSTKHLKYFYETVLGIQGKAEVADAAHLVLELQKHKDTYLLEKGTLIKDGKDSIGKDILFKTEEHIVLDKAQVKELKTLYVHKVAGLLEEPQPGEECQKTCSDQTYIEGVYLAPVANMADGVEESFKDPETASWFTLGSKGSKFYEPTTPPNQELRDHPDARLGFVLASPVLLLNEGDRTIDIELICNVKEGHEDIWSEIDLNKIEEGAEIVIIEDDPFIKFTKDLFNIFLSGEEEWIVPENIEIYLSKTPTKLDIKIKIVLPPEVPAISFYNEEALQEKLNTKLPVAKILLNPDCKLNCPTVVCDPCCDLERCLPEGTLDISLYQIFGCLTVEDSCIEVEVCGVKNVIVQNDENLQDVNGLIYPFGTRPNLDASFYIGSREIFCKNWKDVWVNVTWKDRPSDFNEHYKFYNHYYYEDGSKFMTICSFQILPFLLDQGSWEKSTETSICNYTEPEGSGVKNFDGKRLFHDDTKNEFSNDPAPFCVPGPIVSPSPLVKEKDIYHFNKSSQFSAAGKPSNECIFQEQSRFDITTRESFIKLVLQGVSFQHEQFTYVLIRHLAAIANMIDPVAILNVIGQIDELKICVDNLIIKIGFLQNQITSLNSKINNISIGNLGIIQLLSQVDGLLDLAIQDLNNSDFGPALIKITNAESIIEPALINKVNGIINTELVFINGLLNNDDDGDPTVVDCVNDGIIHIAQEVCDKIVQIKADLLDNPDEDFKAGLPKEPYTPIIKELSLDYCAKAEKEDIELIHLYPCVDTYKKEDLTALDPPTLLPSFEDEGSLFIGLENLVPGNTLNLLFQLAEASADPELDKANTQWYYLRKNEWTELREGFHLLSDETKGLTRSGIVQIAIPGDIKPQKDAPKEELNTIMNPELCWIKVAARENIRAIAETIGIHTQAVKAVYCAGPENQRSNMLVKKGGLAKLKEADTSIKAVNHFYDSFGGKIAEKDNNLYKRISERLRHKGRAINRFDYERLTLEQFGEIWKVKCVNHTMGLSNVTYKKDLELAPGFVLVAVIPDIDQLKISNLLAPRAPLSLLEEIGAFLRTKTSPFVRLKVMNPRYEKVNINVKVKFHYKSPTFYKNKLKEDLINYLSPWVSGDKAALCFGKSLAKSDLISFLECLEYVDYICELCMVHDDDKIEENCITKDPICTSETQQNVALSVEEISPMTARSILIAGIINVTDFERDCEAYDNRKTCEGQEKEFHLIEESTVQDIQ